MDKETEAAVIGDFVPIEAIEVAVVQISRVLVFYPISVSLFQC